MLNPMCKHFARCDASPMNIIIISYKVFVREFGDEIKALTDVVVQGLKVEPFFHRKPRGVVDDRDPDSGLWEFVPSHLDCST